MRHRDERAMDLEARVVRGTRVTKLFGPLHAQASFTPPPPLLRGRVSRALLQVAEAPVRSPPRYAVLESGGSLALLIRAGDLTRSTRSALECTVTSGSVTMLFFEIKRGFAH